MPHCVPSGSLSHGLTPFRCLTHHMFPILELQAIPPWPPLSSAFFAQHCIHAIGRSCHSFFSFLRTIPCAGFQDVALPPVDRPFPENRLLGPPRVLILARNPQQGLLGGRLCAHPARLGMLASGPNQDDQQCPQPLPTPPHKCFLPSLTKTELLPSRTPPPHCLSASSSLNSLRLTQKPVG